VDTSEKFTKNKIKNQKIDPDIKYEFVESDNESDLSENTTDTNSEKWPLKIKQIINWIC